MSVPGAQMLSKQECLKNPKEKHDTTIVPIVYTVGKGKSAKVKKENLIVKTRRSRDAKHCLNISSEGYYHMIDSSESPSAKYSRVVGTKKDGTPISLWSTMKITERLKVHLDLIAEHFCASSYSYEILDD